MNIIGFLSAIFNSSTVPEMFKGTMNKIPMFARLVLSTVPPIVLQACSTGFQGVESLPQPHDSVQEVRTMQGAFNGWKALQFASGGTFDVHCGCIRLPEKHVDADVFYGAVPVRVERFWSENSTERYFVLAEVDEYQNDTGEKSHRCHACSVTVGATLFSLQSNERDAKSFRSTSYLWRLDAADLKIAVTGSYGTSGVDHPGSATRLVKVGPNKYGMLWEHWHSGNQGREFANLHLIAEVDGGLRDVADVGSKNRESTQDFFPLVLQRAGNILLYEEMPHVGFSPPEKWIPKLEYYINSAYDFIPGNNRDYYDLRVVSGLISTREGVGYDEISKMQFEEQRTRMFSFDGTRYKQVSETTDPIITLPNPGIGKTIKSKSRAQSP